MATDDRQSSWVDEEEFLAYAEEQIRKVRETIGTLNWVNTGAWGTVVRTVHNLRGSAGMTGHGAVAVVLEGLEKKLGRADNYTETQLSEEVNASLERVVEALHAPRAEPQPKPGLRGLTPASCFPRAEPAPHLQLLAVPRRFRRRARRNSPASDPRSAGSADRVSRWLQGLRSLSTLARAGSTGSGGPRYPPQRLPRRCCGVTPRPSSWRPAGVPGRSAAAQASGETGAV